MVWSFSENSSKFGNAGVPNQNVSSMDNGFIENELRV